MSASMPTDGDRLLDLLAERAVEGLDAQSREELERLLAASDEFGGDELELAAAAADLAMMGDAGAMPAHVRARIEAQAEAHVSGNTQRSDVAGRIGGGGPVPGWTGWLAAAAAIAMAFAAWMRPSAPGVVGGEAPTIARSVEVVDDFIAEHPSVKVAQWSDWDNPEVAGVEGRVVWSETDQTGYMTFEGLRSNDPGAEQYQLWIIDERGMGQRISGAIFDAQDPDGDGTVVVRIDPRIRVRNAAAFAVTIEQPGGTWVSDMERRVVIASLPAQG